MQEYMRFILLNMLLFGINVILFAFLYQHDSL